ncbi:MAG: PA0069 family radical SAM protein [Methylohalobius sp.]|nr:PA0069 family radical SAM protein [Methylohalobius sp.]
MNRTCLYKGRGAVSNPDSRYNATHHEPIDGISENWDSKSAPRTEVSLETPRTIISRNRSPDLPFDQSLNPYRGCEHGCIYCYARPTHAYLNLSPGLDFETKLTAKPEAAKLLRSELQAPGYRCSPIALGSNTDPYQPIERRYRITRQILEVLCEFNHPLTITTKSSLVERDLDILAPMAQKGLVQVYISLTTLQPELARTLEPRATAPHRRLETIANLREARVPVGVLVAPVIPVLTEAELESILKAASAAGAQTAGYVLLRLPQEVALLFEEWLNTHFPHQAKHVLSRIRAVRKGEWDDPRFGYRMRGEGVFADLIGQRFRLAARRLKLDQPLPPLEVERFRSHPQQLELF